MEKGLEITFNVSDEDKREITEALANLVGNEFMERIEIDWRIFHVKLGNDRFFKVCFTGPKMTRLHPIMEDQVRNRFDELSKKTKKDLLKIYHTEEKKGSFKRQYTKEIEEEYDLWQDNFWAYF